jgi:hydroxylamine dehydrogenase
MVILQAMGVPDANGKGTERLDAVQAAKIARLSQAEFDALWAREMATCEQCHAQGFVEQQFAADDALIRQSDQIMAEAITVVNGLYKDGYLKKPADWKYAPDLLQFYESDSTVEHELFTMFLEYRQRMFQGAFHANPDYTYWYGLAQLQNSLQFIKDEASNIRANKASATATTIFGIAALVVAAAALCVGTYALYRKKSANK